MKILGKATLAGTQRYRERHQQDCVAAHFREANDWVVSSIGIGTYLGAADSRTDDHVTDAIIESVKNGINLIDTAINYRSMHAEWSVSDALLTLMRDEVISRDEFILCTKGGFIPDPERISWFYSRYIENSRFSIEPGDLVAECHCLHPEYIGDQLERSLDNLGVETIDIYYLHNPEMQLSEVSPEIFYSRLKLAFEGLEKAVSQGKISSYGLATWDGFRVQPNHPNHLDLAKIKAIATQVAPNGTDHFKFIQLPFNATRVEALVKPTQQIKRTGLPVLEAAHRLGLSVISSASIGQTQAIGHIPEAMQEIIHQTPLTPTLQALQFTRSCPRLLTALVGMKTIDHVRENLALTRIKPLAPKFYKTLATASV
ncbi:conserved hypothetical protein [Planktothrix serta PCC 8927]|uniref:NADP-dependent oxidoreductase domain-containing protein n=1 Tax=Planktothrix serta PCC 8927 TaxID=671068 RepID=A0A7Z9BK29_9CYAN|nr:aldo/keto reductase [Planktothrix serta]VXD11720.1 conserved hypothetical protein [Planktothrix serta PCC 8927]